MKQETLQAVKQAYKIEAECIAQMLDYLDEQAFSNAVELLKNATRIGTCGCGHSGIICQHMAHLMCCIERIERKYIGGEFTKIILFFIGILS